MRSLILLLTIRPSPSRDPLWFVRDSRVACGVLTLCPFHSLDCKLSEGKEGPWGCFAPQGLFAQRSTKAGTYRMCGALAERMKSWMWSPDKALRQVSAFLFLQLKKKKNLFQTTQDIQRAAEPHFPGRPAAAPTRGQLGPVPPGHQPSRAVPPVQSRRQPAAPRHEALSHHQRR